MGSPESGDRSPEVDAKAEAAVSPGVAGGGRPSAHDRVETIGRQSRLPGPSILLLHLAQAGVYGAVAWELSHRWVGDAAAMGLAAGLQLLALARRPRLEAWLQLACVLLVLAVFARFGAVALHIRRVFGPLAAGQALQSLGAALVAAPWLLGFPLARLWANRPSRKALAALPLALLPALDGVRPYPSHPGAAEVATVAGAAFARWSGSDAALPVDPAALVRVTAVRAGSPLATKAVDGSELGATLATLPSPAEGDALLVDIADVDLPLGLARPGTDAPVNARRAPTFEARALRRAERIPGFSVPAIDGETRRWRSALASSAGVVELDRGWAPGPPEVDAATLDAAIRAAAAQLAGNQAADGRFTYIVKGPSGESGGGYNYPRHAGTAWFLARVWAATGDSVAADAADRAIRHLETETTRTPDGRAFVLDPDRKDGRSWIGTTGLAALALTIRRVDDDLLAAYVRQLAASVDADGKVRGDMRVADGTFADQPANAYGQGQAMLALAAAERAGFTDATPALDRAIRHLESGDYTGSAHPADVGDEHWMCLAARAVRDARGTDAGAGICDAYVADARWGSPTPGGGLPYAAGPGGAAAEAIVARAWDTRSPALVSAALGWARLFLDAQYRPADAPLLGRPAALVGGFRDAPGDLDVQIDAVQHIGGALLGVEALLSGRLRPGSMP